MIAMAQIAAVAGIVVAVLVLLYCHRQESLVWNNGVCRTNGLPWILREVDVHGGRIYEAGDREATITYPFVD